MNLPRIWHNHKSSTEFSGHRSPFTDNSKPGPSYWQHFWGMLLLLVCILLPAIHSEAAREFGIVTASKLNIRATPGTGEPPLVTIPKGSRVEIVSSNESWLQVRYQDITGYVRNRNRYIRIETQEIPVERPAGPTDTTDPEVQPQLDRIKSEAENINEEIELFEKKVLDDTERESEIINSLYQTDRLISKARAKATELSIELKAINLRIAEAQKEIRKLIHSMEQNEEYTSSRLVALYKLNRLGNIHILASSATIQDFFQRKHALERILRHDEKIRQALIDSRDRVSSLLVELSVKKQEKQLVEVEYKSQVRQETDKRNQKKALLAKIRDKKSLELAAIENLKKAAASLDEQVEALSRAPATSEHEGRILPEQDRFVDLKGLLKTPVTGKIVTRFGKYRDPQFNVMNFRTGITIKADRGEPVHAVCGGVVLYAEWFKGYGNLLIIDHGDSYYTLYAHNEELFKSKGDAVVKDEVIATVGDSGSMIGPALHFEVRYHGKPQDPDAWLEKG